MQMDDSQCYRAMLSRDRRFDGRFFTGVRTTGIYCRPVCPARAPRRENATYFPCAAAAEEAGFRPCLRCRPETAPGTPAWDGSSTTVARALRLIDDGALDEGGIDALAGRLGVSSRHLRRLFDDHLGASPISVALTRRLHFARRLLRETALPMTEVAFSAGFSSLRRFNDAALKAWRIAPTAVRRREPSRARGAIELTLGYREPFDWPAILAFLRARAIAGIEVIEGDVYRRSIRFGGTSGVVEVRPSGSAPALCLSAPIEFARDLGAIVRQTRRLFDLDADPAAIGDALIRDPRLARLVRKRPGLRVPGAWDPFELAIRAILGQQVSVKGASTLAARLVRALGPAVESGDPRLDRVFPSASHVAKAGLEGVGLTSSRAATIRRFAEAVASGALRLESGGSLEEAVDAMTSIEGIGPWTAHYIAMRALGEPDAFPASDLGIRKALADNGTLPSERRVVERAEPWRPWRAYASMWLWGSLG
ncbi:MAG: DNA-3-methyladenine glycosylase 2 family protein [Acidobacteria bacterium]|nr:DNA-3-methyladenine glycosylase 2 family protein [Acidobacteriota bacterium]